MTKWKSFHTRITDNTPVMNWRADWRIQVYYEKPDRLVKGGGGDFVFENKHIWPAFKLDDGPVRRDSPGIDESPDGCFISAAFSPGIKGFNHGGELYNKGSPISIHAQEWDWLCEKRDSILQKLGVRTDASKKEQIEALAQFLSQDNRIGEFDALKKSCSKGLHPVDVFLYDHFCTGRSSILCVFANIMGLRSRTINFSGHSVAEVFVENKWLMYENSTDCGSNRYCFDQNYMRITADPNALLETYPGKEYKEKLDYLYHFRLNSGGEDDIIIKRKDKLNPVETSPFNIGAGRYWHFNGAGRGRPYRTLSMEEGHGLTLPLDPSTCRALYPEETLYVFKYNACEPCRLTLNMARGWVRAPLKLKPGDAVRKEFYLGKLEGATGVKASIMAFPGIGWNFIFPFKDWTLILNGKELDLQSVFSFKRLSLELNLPMKDLREEGWNSVELHCGKRNFQWIILSIYPDLLPGREEEFSFSHPISLSKRHILSKHEADTAFPHVR